MGQNTENNVMMCAQATDGGREDGEQRRELVCVVNMFTVLCLYIMHMYEFGCRQVCVCRNVSFSFNLHVREI